MKSLIMKMWNSSVVRYVFFGGCTTLVNLVSYFLLRTFTPLGINISNIISIALAIVFAYFVNAIFVFESDSSGMKSRLIEFGKFVGARLTTMVIEVGGVWLMAEVILINDMVSKIIIQFVVLVLNYVISKFFVFIKN